MDLLIEGRHWRPSWQAALQAWQRQGNRWWLLLGTLRQLVSRLPFLPNKDVVFAGIAAFLIGRDSEIVSAMALMASLILAAHLFVGILLGITGLLRESRAQ